MHNNHRTRLSYYKQIYNFEFLIAQFAHPTWLEDIPVPAKLARDAKSTLAFQSQLLLQNNPNLEKANSTEQAVLQFIASLPDAKFNRFLNYLVLSFLKNDKSLLINGAKLKKLSQFFSVEEMEFLLHEKEVKIKLRDRLVQDSNIEINEFFLVGIAFQVLKKLCGNTSLFERLKYRFPKYLSENQNTNLNFDMDAQTNFQCISTIAQALFQNTFSILESEEIIHLTPADEKVVQNKNTLANTENAYKIPSVHES
ncbi:MAG: hypothetical protein V4591_08100 [Bdellovibrionota bacterium]